MSMSKREEEYAAFLRSVCASEGYREALHKIRASSEEAMSYWCGVARMGFEDDIARLAPAQAGQAERCANLEDMVKLARAVGGIVQIRVVKEEGEVVRVVNYDKAREIDEESGVLHAR